MTGHPLSRIPRTRRNSVTPSVSSDDAAPRSPPNGGLSPCKDALSQVPPQSAVTNVHREWQKLRYSRRSAGSPSDIGNGSTPTSESGSPIGTPAASSTAAAAAPRPSFMMACAASPMALPARHQTFVSPLAEWALSGRNATASAMRFD